MDKQKLMVVTGAGDSSEEALLGQHGRDGLHREQQGALHAFRADQHAPAGERSIVCRSFP